MSDTLHCLLYDGYADWEIAFVLPFLNDPDFQQQPGRWKVQTVGRQGGVPVRSFGGLQVTPALSLADLRPADSALLLLPGGMGWDDADAHADLVAAVSGFVDAGVPVAAICGATAGLARAGLLDDRRHTSNGLPYLKHVVPGYRGEAHYLDDDAVTDRGVITAGGVQPIAFAREIFSLLGVYEPKMLAAWERLYRHGDTSVFASL